MKKKLIITCRVNEYKSRDENRHVPYTPDEIAETAAECRHAGASIIHFHARNADGSPSHIPEVYSEIISKIREATDILIDSTLGQVAVDDDKHRIAHITKAGADARTRPDFAALDTGSTNIDAYDAKTKSFKTGNKVYRNSIETCLYLATEMKKAGVKPHLSCWTVPFMRAIDAFLDMGVIDEPAYVQLVLTEGGTIGGHPGTIQGVESIIGFLPPERSIEWTVCCKEGNLFPAAAFAIEQGGHVAPGIGDYAYPEIGCPTNAELVRRFAEMGMAMGREIATPEETRELLGICKS
jgi:uncharacterized protein (DUF849 family)